MPADASGCPGSSACARRSTSSWPARPSAPPRRSSSAWSTSWFRRAFSGGTAAGSGGPDRAAGRPVPSRARGSLLLERNPIGRALVYRQRAEERCSRRPAGTIPRRSPRSTPCSTGLEQRDRGGAPARGAALRRAGDRRGVPQPRADLLRHHRAQERRRRRPGHRRAAPGPAGSAWWAPDSWARASRAPRCPRPASRCGSRTPIFPGWARASKPRSRSSRGSSPASGSPGTSSSGKSALLSGTGTWQGFERADVVIEAVFEDLEVKRQVMAEVEAWCRPARWSPATPRPFPSRASRREPRHPERMLGMHFFSPVEKMPLLEVIPTRADLARRDRDRGPVRTPDGKDRHRGAGPARVLGQPDPVALPERGGSPAGRRNADRSDRPGHDPVRFSGRSDRAAR